MCDYSLNGVPNRLAEEGEHLAVHLFPTGSLGLAAASDQQSLRTDQPQRGVSIWARIRDWFTLETQQNIPAVCIPPGAKLVLDGIPSRLQEQYGVGATEPVTFVQLSAEPYQYRDAIRFRNGREVLLQRLPVGQRVAVLQLALEEENVPTTQGAASLAWD